MRPTTEQGSRFERCHFNFEVNQEVSPSGAPVSDIIQLVGGNSIIGALSGFGTQATAVAYLLQDAQRDFEVVALTYDVEAYIVPGIAFRAPPQAYEYLALPMGFAINSQRLDGDGAPVTIPPYWLSQWPVNQSSGLTQFEQDRDYALRTHFARSWTLSAGYVLQTTSDPLTYVHAPGWPRFRFSGRTRIGRRFSDSQALFAQFWNSLPAAGGLDDFGIEEVRYHMIGSLWYKMKF